jgi:hypothetical protein
MATACRGPGLEGGSEDLSCCQFDEFQGWSIETSYRDMNQLLQHLQWVCEEIIIIVVPHISLGMLWILEIGCY